jgi:hypothetical protein
VFILEHYFASKSFAAVLEAFSNAYPDKIVPSKTTIHRLVTKFRGTGSVSGVGQCSTGRTLRNVQETRKKQFICLLY